MTKMTLKNSSGLIIFPILDLSRLVRRFCNVAINVKCIKSKRLPTFWVTHNSMKLGREVKLSSHRMEYGSYRNFLFLSTN